MKEIVYTIKDELGIHARPAGQIVKIATAFESEIKIKAGEKSADLKKIFGVMGLGVKQGTEITITIDGSDENEAALKIEEFLTQNI